MWKLVQNKVSITFFSIKIYAKFFRKKKPVFLFTDCHLLLWILTPQLPRETKTKFLLTISMQYQQTSDKNKEKYQLGVIGWSNTKFSELASEGLYSRLQGELLMRSWGLDNYREKMDLSVTVSNWLGVNLPSEVEEFSTCYKKVLLLAFIGLSYSVVRKG